MEVHHHSHPDSGHGGKKWHHYFWEFFMLFLAVTLGFIVENLREHLDDRREEKIYIESLVSDLKEDTSTIYHTTKADFKLLRGMDSLIDILDNYRDNDSINQMCYGYYFNYATTYMKIQFNERTLSQLINSGNMRLIHRQAISDSIIDYNFLTKYVQQQGDVYEEYFKKELDLSGAIFDFSYTRNTLNEDYSITPRLPTRKLNFHLLTKDPSLFKKYTNELMLLTEVLESYMFGLKRAQKRATRLIALLQKEYSLK